MVKIVVLVRPHRLEVVKSAIASLPITGMSVSDCRGRGNSAETSRWSDDEHHLVALPIRSKLEVVIQDELQEEVIAAVLQTARTGEPGDGKIFVLPVEDAIRVRTAEHAPAGL